MKNTLIIILIILVIGLGGYIVYNKIYNNNKTNEIIEDTNKTEDSSKKEDNTSINNNFSLESNTGNVEVVGYASVEERFDEKTNTTITYLLFNVIESNNKDFLTYLNDSKYNGFIGNDGKSIGLGCVDNNILKYSVSSMKFHHTKEISLSEYESGKIINSTKENPIKLGLEFVELPGRGGAPICTSLVANYGII